MSAQFKRRIRDCLCEKGIKSTQRDASSEESVTEFDYESITLSSDRSWYFDHTAKLIS
jgi:hypothetical protein